MADGKAMKRRGLMAGAAALVAGLAAARAEAVSADTRATVLGGTGSTASYGIAAVSAGFDPAGQLPPLNGNTFGVIGTSSPSAPAPTLSSGVLGVGNTYGGVQGLSNSNYGVYGRSTSSNGVRGESTGSNAIGVFGVSNQSIGVYGQSNAVGGYGVVGATDNPSSIGVGGMASADGSSAFSGGTANPNAYAGYFQGHVVVAGSFDVSPLGNKHGVAPHPDGSHRTFYSVESPECWVEDFGTGTLAGGKAEVALDADFAALTHTDAYHVFITEHGGHNGLHTTTKGAAGFTVEADGELAKAKGKKGSDLNGTFSYRVVAKPKTTAKVERLAKATLPTLLLPPMPKDEPPRPTKEP